ncbi:hypothetical protein NDU88_003221 [Pleurodeles waltl]|uniref:Uncharacterized protein n=1 Tax=Pleurodeles waltl TaxID=8319 RepID=A0AAV7LEM3_PLEWA|nr:hypothetical protein NDU88_003221 [Pleurodeles waltl]
MQPYKWAKEEKDLLKKTNDHMWQGAATRERRAIDLCAALAFENSIITLTNEKPGQPEEKARQRKKMPRSGCRESAGKQKSNMLMLDNL